MVYRLYPQTGTRLFTEKSSRCGIPYLPAKKMRKMYPKGDFAVIGEIGSFTQAPQGRDILLIGSKAVPIFPRGSLRRPFEWITGYIAVEESTYVAAVRNLFPAFLQYRNRKR